jgi:hypothetical protein
MGNIFNPDFQEFIQCLEKHHVKYLLVGGYSVILHGHSRTTGDLDVWVQKSVKNYENLKNAFDCFSMPVFDMSRENFLSNDAMNVFSFGRPPVAIDIMTAVKGLQFDEAYSNSIVKDIEGLTLRVIDKNDLLIAKKASNRLKDQDDLNNLQ